jgi:hydrogenase maturation factor
MVPATFPPRLRWEEPGTMTERLIPDCDHTEGCITCGDEAIRMKVIRIDAGRELALCQVADGGERSTVEIALVQPVAEGDTLLVHAGTAIARTDPSEVAA